MNNNLKVGITAVFVFISTTAYAAEMDHGDHNMDHSGHDMANSQPMMDHSNMTMDDMSMDSQVIKQSKQTVKAMPMLKRLPSSGKAREAGFDGKYAMESSSLANPLSVQCEQASRGLVMLDNETWVKCGGKIKGAAKAPAIKSTVMDHSMH